MILRNKKKKKLSKEKIQEFFFFLKFHKMLWNYVILNWLSGIIGLRFWLRFSKSSKSQKLEMKILFNEKFLKNLKIVFTYISEHCTFLEQKKCWPLSEVRGEGGGFRVCMLGSRTGPEFYVLNYLLELGYSMVQLKSRKIIKSRNGKCLCDYGVSGFL